jgi:hypothetical protein
MFEKEQSSHEFATGSELSTSTDQKVSRRSFFRKSMTTGMKVAAGLFTFVPAVQVLLRLNFTLP